MQYTGNIKKLDLRIDENVSALLSVGEQELLLNDYINKTVKFEFSGEINCVHCARKIRKTYGQGYCFPCISSLAECDSCLFMPEKCHYHKGTCREPEWGEQNCLQGHIVYLSNTSALKVGITRRVNVPVRWLDQGAVQAIPIVKVSNRLMSGEIEVMLKEHVSDKTNWRTMLKGRPESLDLKAERNKLFPYIEEMRHELLKRHGPDATVELLTDSESISIEFPVSRYPEKIISLSFDKTPVIESKIYGIKGQYLFLEQGVLNIRKFSGYKLKVTL